MSVHHGPYQYGLPWVRWAPGGGDAARPLTRKIREPLDVAICYDRQHGPPTMQVFSPGVWEHRCPTCGHVTTFEVTR